MKPSSVTGKHIRAVIILLICLILVSVAGFWSSIKDSNKEELLETITHPSGKELRLFAQGTKDELVESQRMQILRVHLSNGQVKDLYSTPPELLEYRATIKEIHFSAQGDYASFVLSLWEGSELHIFDIETGRDIVPSTIKNSAADVFWGIDDSFVVIVDHHSPFSGSGQEALYVSEYGNPATLRKVITIPPGALFDSRVENVRIEGNKVLFSTKEAGKVTEHVFDVETNKLD